MHRRQGTLLYAVPLCRPNYNSFKLAHDQTTYVGQTACSVSDRLVQHASARGHCYSELAVSSPATAVTIASILIAPIPAIPDLSRPDNWFI